MPGSPDRASVARRWIAKAEGDLYAADLLLAQGIEGPPWIVAFHAQQGAEKYLKCLLSWESIPFPRVHDIGELVELLPPSKRPDLPIPLLSALSEHAVASRYPGDVEPDLEAARQSVAAARAIREFVRKLLPPEALQGS